MARNRNLLGSRTVHALQFITKDTRQAFVSPALVDRMAAMLNYVLSKLVGPKSRELKVWLSLRVCVNYGSLQSLDWTGFKMIITYLHSGFDSLEIPQIFQDNPSSS